MVQIVNISQARNQLSTLIKQVSTTKNPVIIIRDSIPSVIMIAYEQTADISDYKKDLLTIKGDWFSPKEYTAIRNQINKRKRLAYETGAR